MSERGSTYGDCRTNFTTAAQLKIVYRSGVTASNAGRGVMHDPTRVAHDEAIEMCLTKIARIATGKAHADNYDDLIGYATLAKKLALGE